jgi:hypothetical protein
MPADLFPRSLSGTKAEDFITMSDNHSAQNAPADGDAQHLSPDAAQILAAIPAEFAPKQLVGTYPRIFNQIASLWKIPRQMDPYLDSLIMDQRGRRQGFPGPIAWEILRLKEYYQTVVYPLSKAYLSWNSVI